MYDEQQRAILTICLMAAIADGGHDDRERAEIQRIAQSLSAGTAIDVTAIYQQVLLQKPNLPVIAAALTEPGHRQFAYEMAVGVCNADGATSAAERDFLAGLARMLHLDAGAAQTLTREADALASAPLAAPALDGVVIAGSVNGAELDKMILKASIINGALELLPQSLASMAIIPLQVKMVYGIGKAYQAVEIRIVVAKASNFGGCPTPPGQKESRTGRSMRSKWCGMIKQFRISTACYGFELDRGHITDLLATLGVGLTSQYVEQFGRKLLGGLLGRIGGGLLGGVGSVGTGAAFSFATTYALGQVARRYYAGGRKIDAAGLKQTFASMLGEAKQLQGQYTGQIAEQARTLDVSKLLAMVKS